jgi:hypothetical protein
VPLPLCGCWCVAHSAELAERRAKAAAGSRIEFSYGLLLGRLVFPDGNSLYRPVPPASALGPDAGMADAGAEESKLTQAALLQVGSGIGERQSRQKGEGWNR